MTQFYTGRGDKGKSQMGAKAIHKDDPLFRVLGALDELNSWFGLCLAYAISNPQSPIINRKKAFLKAKSIDLPAVLLNIQETLFIAQAEIAAIGMNKKSSVHVSAEKTEGLEAQIKTIDEKLPTIKNFIIPGASELSARLDVARAMTRQLERNAVAYSKKKNLRPELLQYLNRLLF